MKRKIIPILVLLVAVCLSQRVQSQGRTFDPDGSFWIIGKVPNEFLDFSGINLNAKRLRRLEPAGVLLNTGQRFRYKTLTVSRQKFTFTTVAVGGVSYSFSGRFLKGGVYAAATLDEDSPVLEGVLTKFKAGQKVAEAQLKFAYFGGT